MVCPIEIQYIVSSIRKSTLLEINAKLKKSNSNTIRAHEHIPEPEQAPTHINTWVLIGTLGEIANFSLVTAIKAKFGRFCNIVGTKILMHGWVDIVMSYYAMTKKFTNITNPG